MVSLCDQKRMAIITALKPPSAFLNKLVICGVPANCSGLTFRRFRAASGRWDLAGSLGTGKLAFAELPFARPDGFVFFEGAEPFFERFAAGAMFCPDAVFFAGETRDNSFADFFPFRPLLGELFFSCVIDARQSGGDLFES